MENHHSHNHHHGPHEGVDSAAMAELLDLDANVLHSYLSDVTTWVRQLATDIPRRRVLDLGAGTGTGTIALAERFSRADVIAVDVSEEMLTRVQDKALFGGFAERVRTVQADLNVAWPPIEPVDVVWAALSLHEMDDPEQVLKDVFTTINPGGLLAVVEMDSPPRFLPDDIGLGRPGLEARCHDALEQAQASWEPHPDWGPHMERTGFTIVAKRTFPIDVTPPHPASTGHYARAYLRLIRPVLEGRMATDDLATLGTLLADDGPHSLLHRNDLIVRGTRTAWVARRP
ncbi:class I SAM-dependent methyltransferase [Streptomyces lunaelactis]|uniref:class I SAM-dependent methyltransferase n=2 Tax=Streptomyces lunaelactis TaxID=1535768 RepID=UPI001585B822|nr:class I SAM-dependent methyltransferase [Streptomyces lunaelactis]NUK04347.1 class I SAM-dependent methyltransferase [Streptomyces lunaelactis]NUK06451.1 class I SAM-dependent methyltransferase [Streptomyces lunaelactis]NUK18800.1 class I SAM-dependent methyltransferase [Streptomyces lunaelactis]NUK52340.1 class I SAM-dependent methyltransferase [Streptomyces lunaelactis]NUK64923.1 class I SAM-dependent methyltransferase [Streptomyces lunaelactis]